MAATLRHSKYKITTDMGKITVEIGKNPIAKYYKFNDHVTIGMDSDQDTMTIELKYDPVLDLKRKAPVEIILKHRTGGKK